MRTLALPLTRGECDQRVDQFIKDGGNVVIWFSLTLEKRGGALITSSVAPRCVQESVKRLKKAGLEAVHLISVGGWNVAHPDTAYSGAEWYDKFKRWNKAAAGPGFENGFDGIDWDLEGNDAMVSPDNTFTVEQLQLVANFSKLAKKDGYLTSIAPPQSYLDVGTSDFSLSVTHPALHWHDEFLYAGRNTYAPLLVLQCAPLVPCAPPDFFQPRPLPCTLPAPPPPHAPPPPGPHLAPTWCPHLAPTWYAPLSTRQPGLGLCLDAALRELERRRLLPRRAPDLRRSLSGRSRRRHVAGVERQVLAGT